MLIKPLVKDYLLYIDDGGLKSVNSLGYTYLIIDSFTANQIREHAIIIKKENSIKKLHAHEINNKNYKMYKKIYENLFNKVIYELKRANIANLLSRFGTTKEYNNNYNFVKNSLINILNKNQMVLESNEKKVSEISSYVLVPLITLNKQKSSLFNKNLNLHLIIDKIKSYDIDIEKVIFCKGNKYTGFYPIKIILEIITNTWFDTVMPELHNVGKEFKVQSLNIISTEKDPILEVVDAFSYFIFQFFKCNIKKYPASANEKFKSEYFKEIMYNCDPEINTKDMADFINSNWEYKNNTIISLSNQNIYTFELFHKNDIKKSV